MHEIFLKDTKHLMKAKDVLHMPTHSAFDKEFSIFEGWSMKKNQYIDAVITFITVSTGNYYRWTTWLFVGPYLEGCTSGPPGGVHLLLYIWSLTDDVQQLGRKSG